MSRLRILVLVLALAAAIPPHGSLASPDTAANPTVVIDTTLGPITVELYPDKAPVSVKNFLAYVGKQHYTGLLIHRVVPGFVIQMGGLFADMSEKPVDAPIKNEAGNGLKNERGTLAMARTSKVDSATSQFFINLKDNDFLNHRDETQPGFGYAVFGKVVKGLDVADKIAAVPTTTRGPFQNVPVDPLVMRSATSEPTPKEPAKN